MLDFDPQAIREAIDLGYMLADKPVTTDVLLKDFGTGEKGVPHGYFYVERPKGGGSIKMPYEAFVHDRQVKEGKIA